jgi:hypothetical protein
VYALASALDIDVSTVRANKAGRNGGGLYMATIHGMVKNMGGNEFLQVTGNSSLTLHGTRLLENTAGSNGGRLHGQGCGLHQGLQARSSETAGSNAYASMFLGTQRSSLHTHCA